MNTLHAPDVAVKAALLRGAPRYGSSVVLGEGFYRPTVSHSAGTKDAFGLALLFAQLYSGFHYLQSHMMERVPDYFDLREEPGIPIMVKVTSIEESPFHFDYED